MKKKRLLIYFCICLALFVLLGVSFFYLSKLNALERYNERVDNSYQVIIQTNKLEQNLLNAETGQRGFLLTQEPIFLENYLNELKDLPKIFLKLDYLTSDNYNQQKNLDTLKNIINIQLKFLKSNLTANENDTLTLNHFHESNIYMNKIKQVIENIKQNESYLLAERHVFKEKNNKESKTSSFVSLIISFAVCSVAAIAIITFFNRSEMHRFNLEDKVYKLDMLNREVKDLTLASTHNLQEPMRKVQMLIDRLQYIKAPDSEQMHEQINRIKQIYNQQQEVNNNIVNYYDILSDNGKKEQVDLNELLNALTLELKWKEQFDLSIETLRVINANTHQLKLLFTHIINNSIRFKDPDRKLSIRISGTEFLSKENPLKELNRKKYYTLIISDNAIGLDKEYHTKIFDLFQKIVHVNPVNGFQTGMGLSFCKRIMLNHNGWISAMSNHPNGLSIVLYFPIKG